jgi:hypothetical protein
MKSSFAVYRSNDDNVTTSSPGLFPAVVCVTHDHHAWHHLTQLVSRELDNSNRDFLPFLLMFAWVASIVKLHMRIYQMRETEDLVMITGLLRNAFTGSPRQRTW